MAHLGVAGDPDLLRRHSPLIARYASEIVGSLAGDQLTITLPPPTYLDAYQQWIKNLSQITLFALIIMYGGVVSSETTSGTAVLVVTKPVSRAAFIVVKALIHAVFLAIVVVVIGALITWGLTAAMFGEAPPAALWSSTLVWLVLGVLFIALMTFLSVRIPSAAGAAGAGIGAYVLLAIASIWEPVREHSPAGLTGEAGALAAGTSTSIPVWAVATSLVLATLAVTLAALLFRRSEL